MTKDERSENTVRADKWDEEDYYKIRKEVAQLPAATEALQEITPTARPEIEDVFYLMKKAAPDLLDPDKVRHPVNRAVNEQLEDLDDFKELRRFTKGDLVASAMATVKIEPELEILFDREKVRQKEADKLQELRDELQEKLNELAQQIADELAQQGGNEGDEEGEGAGQGEGEGEEGEGEGQGQGSGQGQGDGQGQGSGGSLQNEIDALKAAIEAAERALKEGLAKDGPSMAAALAKGLGQVLGEARNEQSVSRSFGLSRGQLQRLPAKERLKLAAKMNNPRLREIAEMFGFLRNLSMDARERTVDDIPHTVVGVTLGDDLSRLLSSEYVRMSDDDQEWGWMMDYAEKRLAQFQMEGIERVGKGGIVVLEDGSGSMGGARERSAKAFMLVMADIAKAENRTFHLVHFGGPGEFKTLSFTKPSDFTVDNIIEAAEIYFGGGTDFVTPLDEGMRILKEEFARDGKVESDLILVTDGYCSLTPEWMKKFHEDLEEIDGMAWAVNVSSSGETRSEPVNTLTHGKVMSMNDLKENKGRELSELLKGTQRPEKKRK